MKAFELQLDDDTDKYAFADFLVSVELHNQAIEHEPLGCLD